jgi:hypothetical protein
MAEYRFDPKKVRRIRVKGAYTVEVTTDSHIIVTGDVRAKRVRRLGVLCRVLHVTPAMHVWLGGGNVVQTAHVSGGGSITQTAGRHTCPPVAPTVIKLPEGAIVEITPMF